eukprot:TRINITY_DN80040_c0_g1_i1.p1 TRINITY_DN80040_c0_g1~~TRINITY_DN80040_c0_g1_i1.p1  ORF type:complete len:249 (+),score=40.44 TRINITY_DN80040_c0_g1_i1:25-771(+)
MTMSPSRGSMEPADGGAIKKLFFSSLKDDYTGIAPKESEGRGHNFHALRERRHAAPEVHGPHKPNRKLTTNTVYHEEKSLDDYAANKTIAAFNKPISKRNAPMPTGSSSYATFFASYDGPPTAAMDIEDSRQSRVVFGSYSRQTPASSSRYFHRAPERTEMRERIAASDNLGLSQQPHDFLNSLYKVDIGGRKATGTGRRGVPTATLRASKSLSLLKAGSQTEEDARRTFNLSLLKSTHQSSFTSQGL